MEKKNNQTALYENYKLFTPVKVASYTISHGVVLAPMTRLGANPDDNPSDMIVKFYAQRTNNGNL